MADFLKAIEMVLVDMWNYLHVLLQYILEGKKEAKKVVEILPVDGVRYTVPKYIRPEEMDDTVTVRFRVGDVYKNKAIATYFGDTLISKRKKQEVNYEEISSNDVNCSNGI